MIEALEHALKLPFGNLTDDALFLFHDKIQYNNYEQNEKNKVDRKYEKLSLNVINGAVWLK